MSLPERIYYWSIALALILAAAVIFACGIYAWAQVLRRR